MKKIMILATVTTLAFSGSQCDYAKRDYDRYNSRSLSASNYSLKIDYAKKALSALRLKRDSCFLSGKDKEYVYEDIEDIEDRIRLYKSERYKDDNRVIRVEYRRVR